MTTLDRRSALIAAAGLAAMPAIARGQTSAQDEIVELWPGRRPATPARPSSARWTTSRRTPLIPTAS